MVAEIKHTGVIVDIRMDRVRDASIECHDPMIVRADVLVIDRDTRALGAVVDGVMADLGLLSEDVMNDLVARSHAVVGARHFNGGHVSRSIPIIKH